MTTTEIDILMQKKEKNGDTKIMYPVTKSSNVIGDDEKTVDEKIAEVEQSLEEKANVSHTHKQSEITDLDLSGKADKTTVDNHIKDSAVHVTSTEKSTWNGKAAGTHTHAAGDIKAGTLAGQVVANASAVSSYSTSQIRNIKASTTDLTANSSSLTTGDIYLVYE